jgi:hypothetical protein
MNEFVTCGKCGAGRTLLTLDNNKKPVVYGKVTLKAIREPAEKLRLKSKTNKHVQKGKLLGYLCDTCVGAFYAQAYKNN